jgi:hypothetical protein
MKLPIHVFLKFLNCEAHKRIPKSAVTYQNPTMKPLLWVCSGGLLPAQDSSAAQPQSHCPEDGRPLDLRPVAGPSSGTTS